MSSLPQKIFGAQTFWLFAASPNKRGPLQSSGCRGSLSRPCDCRETGKELSIKLSRSEFFYCEKSTKKHPSSQLINIFRSTDRRTDHGFYTKRITPVPYMGMEDTFSARKFLPLGSLRFVQDNEKIINRKQPRHLNPTPIGSRNLGRP